MTQEFHLKYRPRQFKEVHGQRDAIKTLRGLLKNRKKFPHAILFTGPSGCGKTTLARILRRKLGCGNTDFAEHDCTDFRGIDMVRELRSRIHFAPIDGRCRIYLIDESHQLTTDAQNGLLKVLEDTPKHVYFMLATTDPLKLKRTIKTRCHEIKVEPLARQDMDDLISEVAEKEKLDISEEVVAKINETAEGSARKALVLLNQISELEDEDDQLNAIISSDSQAQAIEIARALIALDNNGKPKTSWSDMCKILKGIDEEPEQLRYMILSYCTTILLSNNRRILARANLIINYFRDSFIESKRAGLVSSCYDVIHYRSR